MRNVYQQATIVIVHLRVLVKFKGFRASFGSNSTLDQKYGVAFSVVFPDQPPDGQTYIEDLLTILLPDFHQLALSSLDIHCCGGWGGYGFFLLGVRNGVVEEVQWRAMSNLI